MALPDLIRPDPEHTPQWNQDRHHISHNKLFAKVNLVYDGKRRENIPSS